MTRIPLSLAAILSIAVSLPAVARAQWYGEPIQRSAPLYTYQVQPGQPYAVEVSPGRYVYYRHRGRADRVRREQVRHTRRHYWTHRQRAERREMIRAAKIVRDKPVVIETRRVVDDPPRVVERRSYAGHALPRRVQDTRRASVPRVIHAEAEVTILGPDRMNIRLFRKRGADAEAKARRNAKTSTTK